MRLKYGIAVRGATARPPHFDAGHHVEPRGPGPTVWWAAGCNHRRLECPAGPKQFLVVESDESDGSFLKLSPSWRSSPTSTGSIWTTTPPSKRSRGLHRVRQQVPFYGAHPLPGRRKRAAHPARSEAPHHQLWHARAAAVQVSDCSCTHLESAFRLSSSARTWANSGCTSRHTQRAERSRAVAVAWNWNCPWRLCAKGWRYTAASTGASRSGVSGAASRSSTTTATTPPRSARRWPPPSVPLRPHSRDLPAPPLHRSCTDGRFRPLLLPSRLGAGADIYALREADRRRQRPIAGRAHSRFGHHGVEYAGTIDRAVERVLALAEDGDAVLTLGAGMCGRRRSILERLGEG